MSVVYQVDDYLYKLVLGRCLGLMTFFGCMSAIFYPVLWIGVIVLSLVPQIGQLYAPPLVILTAFGTVYGLLMILIYYLNSRVGQWSLSFGQKKDRQKSREMCVGAEMLLDCHISKLRYS